MFKYIIKQNDYPIGSALGKKKAIEYIIKEVRRSHCLATIELDINRSGNLQCEHGNDTYTIEQSR